MKILTKKCNFFKLKIQSQKGDMMSSEKKFNSRESIKEKKEKSSIFSKLPEDLKLKSASFFTPKEVSRMAEVSKDWRDILSENELWNQFLQESYRITDGRESSKAIFINYPGKRLDEYQLQPTQTPPPAHVTFIAEYSGVPVDILYRWHINQDERYAKVSFLGWYLRNHQHNLPHALSLQQVLKTTYQEERTLKIGIPYLGAGYFSSIDELRALSEEETDILRFGGSPEAWQRSFEALQAYRQDKSLNKNSLS